ncbi:MAG: MipA/OmpV family protein [Deltaproteobacteria bacterium HGW-Deltaproteobacteria-21]|nr:MAG: MipA/OmpV family protein [Deltaproteobacteria bacterium HGW-Deltaproteobacteria-21]
MNKYSLLPLPLLLSLFLAVTPVLAEDVPLWEIGIGVAAWHLPDYKGSNESRFYALPFPYPIYRGKIIRARGTTLSGLLFESDRLRLDLSMSGSLPVNSEDNTAREGMPDLDFTGEVGPSLEWRIFEKKSQSLWLKMPLRGVFAVPDVSYVGLRFAPYLDYEWMSSMLPGWTMSFTIGPNFGSRRYHEYFYEVEPEFARADRPEYHPDSGYGGSGVSYSLARRFKDIRISSSFHYDRLTGAAFEDSPLVKTRNYFRAGVTLTWFFAKSKTLVPKPSREISDTTLLQSETTD